MGVLRQRIRSLIFAHLMEFFRDTLPNGIRIVLKPTENGQTAHFGLTINAGSRDELEHEQGLAHFIEHSLFKGTRKRKAFHILSRMDSVGAELNAYTTKEETVIYASSLPQHFERGMEVIADITLNSTFPEKEIAKERDVIVDEIQSYQDSPAESIFDDFEEMLFANQPLGRNILGTIESVRGLSSGDIRNFIGRRYRPSDMVLSAVGPIEMKRFRLLCEKYFSELTPGDAVAPRDQAVASQPLRKLIEMDTFQAHLLLGTEAYRYHHPLQPALVLLSNYLGGPAMNSRLNMNIRERHGIAYNIEASYQPYADTGIFSIYLGTDKKLMRKSESLVRKELDRLRKNILSTTALHRAKQQFKGQFALAQEGGANLMLALGKSIIAREEVRTTAEIFEIIDAITVSEIIEVANDCFNPDKLSVLIYQ